MPDAAAPARIARPDGWQILKRNRTALVALWFLAGLSLVAIVGPMLLPATLKSTSNASFVPPMQSAAETASLHVLGTDVNGQDMLYRIFSGARVSLGVGLLGALISLFIGTLYGMISGYVGGRVDAIMMRTVEILQSIPRILVIMMLIAALDDYVKEWVDGWRLMAQEHNWTRFADAMNSLKAYSKVLVMIISLGIVEWLTMARIVRGQVLVLREMTFVTASRAMGQGSWGVLRRHLLPNLSTIILTYLTLTIPAVILDESFLSFLGLGIEDPASSWGSLLKDGAPAINPIESKWWLLLFPALFMSASLLALNFLGDGLRDAFDPKSGN